MGEDMETNEMLKIVEDALSRVRRSVKQYRRRDSHLMLSSLIGSTLATLLAGGMAAGGAV